MVGMADTPEAPTEAPPAVVLLSQDAVCVLAGLLAPAEEDINADGIFTTEQVWAEIRAAFPVHRFRAWAEAHPREELLDGGGQGYDPEAGF